jgi:hypothetical protein
MIHRFTAHRPRALRGLIVITAALLGAVVPVTGAPAASARTTPAAAPIVRTVQSAAPLSRGGDGQCVEATVLAVEKRRLLKNADHFAGAVDAVLRNPSHHRCAALVDYLRQTSA